MPDLTQQLAAIDQQYPADQAIHGRGKPHPRECARCMVQALTAKVRAMQAALIQIREVEYDPNSFLTLYEALHRCEALALDALAPLEGVDG